MGMASINFHYQSKKAGANELAIFLDKMNFQKIQNQFNGYLNFVLKTNDSLIEFMIGVDGHIYIRVALCNPPTFAKSLQKVVEKLFDKFNGEFMNEHSRKCYKFCDEKLIDDIMSSYNEKRDIFVEYYGDFFAPIGDEDVSNYIEKHGIISNSELRKQGKSVKGHP
ncbi:MAG: hypothetical protein IPL83_12440 [Bdellovibrionales bacterium]|nr:hypothetical protein [Bdellovibrionales bacterium]